MSSAAATSSSLSTTIPSILVVPTSEKRTKSNYPLWHAQVLPALHVVQLDDLLTSEEKQPDKEITVIIDEKSVKQCNLASTEWMACDQAVLGYLLSSLTHETLMHVSWCTTSAQAWHMLADLYASQSCARAINTRIVLAATKKLHLSVTDYYTKMCEYADELAATRAPLRDDELVTYILAGLDEDYNPVFTAVLAQTDLINPSELYSQLLSFEQHNSLQAPQSSSGSSSAMATTRSHGSTGGRGYGGPNRGRGRGRGHGRSNRGGGFSNTDFRNSHGSTSQPQCQVCLKIGHTAKSVGIILKRTMFPNNERSLLHLLPTNITLGTWIQVSLII
jgi:hypothetical protein